MKFIKSLYNRLKSMFIEMGHLKGKYYVLAIGTLILSFLWPLAGFILFILFVLVRKDHQLYGKLGLFGAVCNLLVYLCEVLIILVMSAVMQQ